MRDVRAASYIRSTRIMRKLYGIDRVGVGVDKAVSMRKSKVTLRCVSTSQVLYQ